MDVSIQLENVASFFQVLIWLQHAPLTAVGRHHITPEGTWVHLVYVQ